MNELERQFCNLYQLDERALRNREYLFLLEMLVLTFKEIKFQNVSKTFLNYKILSEITSNKDLDEAFVGTGDNIKTVILTQCMKEEAIFNDCFYRCIRSHFMKFPQRMREAFNTVFGG